MEKLIWSEGLLLAQQHFQQWDDYHDRLASFRSDHARPCNWGVSRLEYCDSSLANGILRITACDVIFRNGRVVRFTDRQGELALDFHDCKGDILDIYLCIPANNAIAGISGYSDNGTQSAWRASYRTVADLHDPDRKRELAFAEPNLMLKVGSENLDHYDALKIMQVSRLDDMSFRASDRYAPPCLRYDASPVLVEIVRRLTDLVRAKARIVSDRRRSFNAGIIDFGINDLLGFVFLERLSEYYMVFEAFRKNTEHHPMDVFMEMGKLYGSLCSLTEVYDIDNFPSYRHDDPGKVFIEAIEHIESLIERVMPTSIEPLKLVRENDNIVTAEINDTRMLESRQFFLCVLVERETAEWINEFGKFTRIAARKDLEELVISAMPGIGIRHIQRPPTRMPVKAGYEYFMLEKGGRFWEAVRESRTLSLFITDEYADASVEIITLDD